MYMYIVYVIVIWPQTDSHCWREKYIYTYTYTYIYMYIRSSQGPLSTEGTRAI